LKRIIVFLIISIYFCLPYGSAAAEEMNDAHKPHQHRHREYAKIKNPIAMTEQSIAEGRKLFENYCMACHVKTEKGGIDPDLKGSLWIHGNSDGEIFHVISAGVKGTAMKGFKDELSEEMRWHLVNYIKSLKYSDKIKHLKR
jgi:mono/diheme cytochrome c family protein